MERYIVVRSFSHLMLDRKNRIFLLVSAAVFMDMMVYSLVIPVLPAYSSRLGADTVTIGVIFGAFSIALLVFSIPFGVLSDTAGRRIFLVLGMLTLAATNVVFAVSNDVSVLIGARLLQGMSGAATWSAGLALLADTFGPEERGRRLGLAMAIMSLGTLIGPVVGGILYDNLGYAPTFILPSVLACVVGLSFFAVREPPRRTPCVPFRERLAPFRKAPVTSLVLTLTIVVSAITYGIVEPYMPVYMDGAFSATPTMIGLAFGAMALLSIVSLPLIGKLYDARGGRILIATGLIGSALVLAGSAVMPSFILTAAVFSLLGITMGFVLTPMLPLLTDLYGDGEYNILGLVYGIFNTLFSLGLAIGPLAGGVVISNFTFRAAVFGQALLLIAAGIVVFAVVRQPANRFA